MSGNQGKFVQLRTSAFQRRTVDGVALRLERTPFVDIRRDKSSIRTLGVPLQAACEVEQTRERPT